MRAQNRGVTFVNAVSSPVHARDPYLCPRCRETDIIDQPYRDASTAARPPLYVVEDSGTSSDRISHEKSAKTDARPALGACDLPTRLRLVTGAMS